MAKPRLRQQIAQEAARLMTEGGIRDIGLARRKAASRFGRVDRSALPSDEEIGLARQAWHQIYAGPAHALSTQRLRRLALEAMRLLQEFQPVLIGDAWEGTPHGNSAIVLQLFAEFPEQVIFKLQSSRIPYAEMARQTRPNRSDTQPEHAGFGFLVDGVAVELHVYPSAARLPTGRPKGSGTRWRGGNLTELLELIEEDRIGATGDAQPERR